MPLRSGRCGSAGLPAPSRCRHSCGCHGCCCFLPGVVEIRIARLNSGLRRAAGKPRVTHPRKRGRPAKGGAPRVTSGWEWIGLALPDCLLALQVLSLSLNKNNMPGPSSLARGIVPFWGCPGSGCGAGAPTPSTQLHPGTWLLQPLPPVHGLLWSAALACCTAPGHLTLGYK